MRRFRSQGQDSPHDVDSLWDFLAISSYVQPRPHLQKGQRLNILEREVLVNTLHTTFNRIFISHQMATINKKNIEGKITKGLENSSSSFSWCTDYHLPFSMCRGRTCNRSSSKGPLCSPTISPPSPFQHYRSRRFILTQFASPKPCV